MVWMEIGLGFDFCGWIGVGFDVELCRIVG